MHSQWAPLHWDRKVAGAAHRWGRWKQRNQIGADPEDEPLARSRDVSGLEAFAGASELSADDPLRQPLRRWIYRLAEQRINHSGLTTLNLQRQIPVEIRDTPDRKPIALAEILKRAVKDAPYREVWLDLYLAHCEPLSSNIGMLWERRAEFARRMGLKSPAEIESCTPNSLELAQQLNMGLRDRIAELELQSPAEYLQSALGNDCISTWPAHLTRRNLLEFFRQTDLFRAVSLQSRALPRAVGAASFMRGLGSLGASWAEALAPQDQPFVIAHDPYGLQRHTTAALFATLPLNPEFLGKQLNVSSRHVPEAQRRLARLWLLDLTARAFRVQVRQFALAGRSQFFEAYRSLAHSELGLDLPSEAAGSLFRLRVEDQQRFVGALRAYAWQQRLTEEHDLDWFRNPRAIEQLREEAQLPPPTEANADDLKSSLTQCLSYLHELLG